MLPGLADAGQAKKVWDQNQFGTQVLTIGKTTNLCLPSLKRVIVPVDHQLCYTAAGKYKIPAEIELFNQFSPKGFVPKVGPVAIHCNPVIKTLANRPGLRRHEPGGTPAVLQESSAAQQPTPEVVVTNQFGSGPLLTRPAEPAVPAVLEEPDRPAASKALRSRLGSAISPATRCRS